MISEQQQEQATLYALGALPPEERQDFEAELACDAELRELVRQLQRTNDLLAVAAKPLAPPAELRQKVLRRIEAAALTSRPDQSAKSTSTYTQPRVRPGFQFHGAADAKGWKELPVRGAWIKLLSIEPSRGYAVLLGRLEAGVRYPAHQHLAAEEIYVLTGDLHIGELALGPGDFHHADGGTAHGVNYSVEGCTLLAVLPAEHELVQFAMAGGGG